MFQLLVVCPQVHEPPVYFCLPRPHVLKHIKIVFQDMNKTTTKGYVGGGGYTEVVAFVHTLRNSYKKREHRSLVQVRMNYVATTRILNCSR